jgi:hypothetical protein
MLITCPCVVLIITLPGINLSDSAYRPFPTIDHYLLSTPSIFDKARIMGKRRFATVPFSYNTTRSDFIEGVGLLTAGGVRHITSPLSWRPASAGHRQRAKLPETRQYGLINGKAPS